MKIFKFLTILFLLQPFSKGFSQSPDSERLDFVKFVSKNYRLPEELKPNCEWMYAIVKVKTDAQNKIIKYEF
jgi:hypothetical protein